MGSRFGGFPPEMAAFFRGLERNNRRDWFQPRKQVYEEKVKAPMVELVTAVNRDLARVAPEYVNDPDRAIYRIYRDTRFSADKTPYKTHIAAVFPRRGLEKHAGAGLYFSVSHKEVEVAGGLYMPGREQLLAIRGYLAEHHREFRRILASRRLRRLMGEMQGERLSRPPKGFDAGHPAAELVRYKQWLFDVVLDGTLAFTAAVGDAIIERFRALVPVVEFLNAPLAGSRKKPAADLLLGP